MKVLGLIPARKGSKSIPGKNLVPINGIPLIQYAIKSAQATSRLDRIVCSTDDPKVKEECEEWGVPVLERKPELATDDAPIIEVMRDVLREEKADVVVLIQPTSPFTLPDHIDSCVRALESGKYNSAQTIAKFPHNYHAFNQRVVHSQSVSFYFEAERAMYYNKQRKPQFYMFGNVVATRVRAIKHESIFALPSYPVLIPYHYALDLDGPEDIELAEWYLDTNKVKLSYLGA